MSNFVMVPVPEERVQDVYALLGKPAESESRRPSPDESQLSDEWSKDEIVRAYRESPATIKQMLRRLAEDSGTWISSDKLYRPLGYSSHQFAGMMGAFGRRVKNRYSKSEWFFEYRWDDKVGMVVYRMNPPASEFILELV